jgi:hypothetical protein
MPTSGIAGYRESLLKKESLISNACEAAHEGQTLAAMTQASALAIETSNSLARRRLRPSQPKVRATTDLRGSSLKAPTDSFQIAL